ncbi:TPA: hemagglutinin repeat-containing protein [Neisseria meningitidis]|uniref:Hemagglutinin/hemolysin-related protein n=14 Tax=Neisseria meningitidis TaxID=487 RepID=Q9K0T0_NEIMB|nr:hemagglutinin repeat-containing protein [Neisseria meningitidis]AAF40927.1 hemagglutinin/hemolysin-related protein [Neisseria meningitidis MC58]ADY96262.1 hemagglutinin/hemolysin family protein [Neisseria meningitidis H44/76]ARC08399.1 hemagglutinin [Neisseria meningitidis]EFV63446.1 filamentous hemagglutinin family N-terminal domain protein [Neisseria meningitidis H44/76]EGC62224.1 hemagglutinin/hemolysin family protein [Neisseria meningitidis CU385]
MNRTLYKVVFNKHRNCMIAVAENAKREGKNTADTQAVGILPNDIAGFAGFIHSISVISFSLSLLLGSALILTSSSATAQGIVADKSAPAQQQPTILQTGNGIPQVNIQTPTSAGVSVNQYAQFDVGNRGAILNNSRSNTQTQLGGWIQGNPWLARGEARVVVNQINSSHSSQLNGYIEVGGRRAEVVIANPAGIAVNGGGFINASRATLTTAQPQYQAGDLSGFKIRQGNVVIAGHGLDARDTDYTRILSYHSKIDAPVWGQDVRVVAGQNDVAATGDAHSPILNNAAANTSNNTANNGTHIPLFAIDTGKLGGMYANKITLISTVEQAGIRNQGQWFASAGNVAVNAEGKLVNTGMIAATGENHAVSLHARNVHNSGTVASQDDANIHSQTLDNSGTVLSSGRLTVRNLGRLKNQNNGTIQAARLDMSTGGLDNTGNITQTGSQALDLVSAGKFDNSGKIGVSDVPQTGLNPNPSVIPQIPSTATGSGSSTVSVSKPGSNNPVSPTAPAKNYAVGRIQTTGAFDNAGSINAGGQIDIAAQNGLGNSGSLNAAKLRVSGDSFNNTVKGKLQAHDLAVNTQTAKNSGHLLTQTGKIDNRELHNAGEIAANNLTLIHSGRLSNDKKGNIRAAHLQLDTAGLHNAGNILADSGTVTTKNNLRNTGKVSVARLNTEGQTLDNTRGRIEAETVNIQSQQLTNQSGHITATEQLTINSRNVDNQNGKLLSANQAQLAVSDGLYNQHGEIATNRQLSIHDKNQNTLALNNADGTIQSAGNVSLQAKSLANNGTLTAGNKLDIALTDDFVVERDLTAGKQLNLSIKGRLKNTHTLQAGHTLKLNAGNIDNQVTGKIIGGEQTDITSEQHVDNRGLINSDGLTHIGAGQTLTNTGTGKIYGNHIALDAQILLNREETTEGSTKAGAIAARKRLDIGAKEIHNQEGALLSSEGIFAVGNRLDEQHHAAGMADTFVNGSAGLEVQGDALMSVRNMQNINNHFKTETYLAKAEKQVRDYTVLGQNTYYQAGKDGLFDNSQGQKDQTTATFHLKNGSRIEANQWHVRDYHIETYKERIIENRPAHITVGGDLTASGQNWLNKDSRIVVGGRIITDDLNQKEITNQSTTGKGRTDAVGTQWDSVTKKGWYSGRKRQRRTERNHTPYHDTQLFTHDFDTPVSVIQQNAASPSFQPAASAIKLIDGVSTAAVNGQRIHTGNVVSLNNATVTLPNSSLYTTHPDNKGWLVETDPQFADYRRWLGSDYMLQQLQLDTNHLHKRLGDGYYEQKLVNEQIHQLTGYRRLDGYRSDEEQFKALMDNGLTAAKTFGLTPGIALSAEQVARLTSDIVWMENQTVTLSDGSTQTVLVPKVYALARKGDLNTSGGLISAEQVLLKLQNGNLTNSGTIAGRQAVLIQARNINSNGNIQADQIGLKAEKSINIDGGQVQAGRLLTAQAQNINLNGTTQTSGNERNGNTAIDRMAGINVVGSHTEQVDNRTSDGILSLHASNDINLNAATVSNQVKDGTTQITAGNNLNLGTIRTEHREAYGTLDDENHRHVRQSTEVGSSIRTQNGALLRAGNDLKIRQGELEAEEGKTVLAAGRDVTISEGRQITELDTSVSGKSKGILSSTKTHDRYRFSHDEAVGSNIGGGKMIVAAGQDINVRGSNLISDKGIVLKAGHDIDISTAHNRYTGNEYHESKKSGVMGTGGLGFTIGNRKTTDDTDRTNIVHTGSIIGSLNGDTVTVAGNRYRQTGSTVSSPEGRNTVTAKSIDVEFANNRYATDYAHTQEQKGLTVALNVPVVQAAQNFIQAAQNVGKSKNKRVNAMAAANAAWQSYQATQQMQQFAPSSSAGQGQNNNQSPSISVSITYGEQKSRNEQKRHYTEAAASQIIGKGQTTLAATGSGEQSNINITGSDVIGHAGTALIADNHIRLQSAKQDGSEQSKNKSSGWNAGVAVKIGNGIRFGITAGGNIGKGKEQGGSTTHRHTHVGSTTGKTTIRSGGDTTLKGVQLIGKGIQADTRNLHIESVQDTETYQSKQQNGNVQVTVGYGFSASGSYRQSKVKADHASVTGQSGIYAGEDGYQIKVRDNTDLKGGIITSSQSAEDKGKNLFQTATLTASDIQNHSRYEGRSFGIGGSFDLNGGWDGTVTDKQGRPTDRISPAAGYGSDGDSKNSTTRSGVNTHNIHITDEAGQLARTGRTAKETEARIYTGIDTETADQHSGHLKNSFDKDAVAKEINLQREVTKEFGRNAAQAVAAVADKLGNTQSYERYQEARTLLEAELQNTDSEAEKAAFRASLGQVNAYLAENQSRYDTWKEGGIGRSILHGAAGGLTTGSLGGILAGGGTSLAAPYLDKAAENLGPAGKAAVNALGGAAIGYATGGSGGAVVGANVDWNNRQLHPKEMALADKYAEALKREVEKREGRKISSQEAAMRIRRQILRWVDKGSQDGYTDQSVISLIGMKGEDKALGYTWDYRDYGARNPQTYNDPKLFEEYRRQDKPEYRNLTWLHSGTKDTKIRQGERKNEEFALNVAEGLTSLVNPNPRIKVPILAGIRNLKNIKPTVTGSDPLLAGAGNIRIPANGNVAKGDRIPDTALASKGIKHKNRKDQLEKNKKSGEDFEMEIYQKKVKQGFKPQRQITVKTKSGVKTRLDIISKEGGLDVCTECKASITAPLTKNQKKAFPEIERTGATVVGKGKPGYPKGTKIEPTKVIIERKR